MRPAANVREQPTLIHRGSFVEVDDRAGGVRPVAQSPYRWSAARSGVKGPAAYRGEHNAEVLAEWLGKSAEEAQALSSRGIMSSEESTAIVLAKA